MRLTPRPEMGGARLTALAAGFACQLPVPKRPCYPFVRLGATGEGPLRCRGPRLACLDSDVPGLVSSHGLLGNGALRRYAPIGDVSQEVVFDGNTVRVGADGTYSGHGPTLPSLCQLPRVPLGAATGRMGETSPARDKNVIRRAGIQE